MPGATGNLSGSGPQQVYVWLSYSSMNQPQNFTTWYWELVYKNNGGQQWMSDANHNWTLSGFAASGPNWFGIPSSWVGSGDHMMGSGFFNKWHNSAGYLAAGTMTGSISSGHANIGSGSASVSSGTPPRVPKVPGPPPMATFISSETDSLTFQIYGPADNGGSGITQYSIYVHTRNTDGSYTAAKGYWGTGSIQTVTGLEPATEYYVQYRAQNAYGTGPWSTITGAMSTEAGIYVSDGANWIGAGPRVSDGAAWSNAVPEISTGSAWQEPLNVDV